MAQVQITEAKEIGDVCTQAKFSGNFLFESPKKGMRTLDVTQSEEQTIRGKYKKKEKNK